MLQDNFQNNLIRDSTKFIRIKDASEFLKVSKSYLYKLTSKNLIHFYKPNNKLILFDKADLIKWVKKKG